MQPAILFAYDPNLSRKNGQFTVLLTPALSRQGKWELLKGTKVFFVRDLESVAAQVPDRAMFRMALESEMAFRRDEGRFFNRDEEFTRLRIASRHLFAFIHACQKGKALIHPDGSAARFRVDRQVIPEIEVRENRVLIHLGSLDLTEAQVIIQTMPVTLIKDDLIVQLRPDLPFAFLEEIPAGKALGAPEREQLILKLSRQSDKLRIRKLGQKEFRVVRDAAVQAVLSLDEQVANARLFFHYLGNPVKDNDEAPVMIDTSRHLEIHRSRKAEEGFKAVLSAHGFSTRSDRDYNWRVPGRPLETLVPSLENHGFAVKIGNRGFGAPVSVKWRVKTQNQTIQVGGTIFTGEFEFGLDRLFTPFQEGRHYVERPDGSLGIISGDVWRVLSDLSRHGSLEALFVTFNKADFTTVRACLHGEEDVSRDSTFEALDRFSRIEGIRQHRIPNGLETVLRPYQVTGFNWLRTLKELGLNGIIADDMGLGKSVQVLALIKSLKQENALPRPVLLIAPKTLIFNWELELKKFAPDLSAYAFIGPARNRTPGFLEKHDLIITSYGLLRTETPLLSGIQWEYVILDEAQAIKNAETLTARAVRHLPAASRLSITGTPVENSAADLWSQFDFLMPGFLGDFAAFKETYADSAAHLAVLRQKTSPYILRRLKSQVLAELPPKTEVTLYCGFAEDQKMIYDQALAAAREEMDAMEGSRPFHILRLILRLRQIACHPGLAVKRSRTPLNSGKTEEILHTAAEILSEGHKILIFSQFTRHLQIIRTLFHQQKIPTFYLDGRTVDRASVVQAFKAHEGPCPFLISLKAGGTGLNLSEASYVFLLDPWWNPAVENQAIDRSHRLGQHQPVTVYRFITRDSIEEKVDDLKKIKQEIESAVIAESSLRHLPVDEKTMKQLLS